MGHTPLPSRPSTPSVVHPHARGAYQLKWRFWTPYNGSSPPTWGIRCSTAPTIDISRFIPTYVGHTAFGPQNAPAGSVHPHTRGAYVNFLRLRDMDHGSSPHTWGIHRIEPECQLQDRFIPTYVGHSGGGVATVSYSSVHPHIRGAYLTTCTLALSPNGSSPHTWGILTSSRTIRKSLAVHPHIRGAYSNASTHPFHAPGSSPHTWGIPHCQ